MLGTGNALVTRCYNTCFAIQDDDEYFLVDAGGGNGIMRQLQDAGIPMEQIHHIFLTHEHTDHLLGMIWMIRMIATKIRKEQYEGNLRIYCHSALVETVRTIANLTLPKKFTRLLDHRIQFVPLHNGDTKRLRNGQKLTCAGDEPLNEQCVGYAESSDWLMHEAFCLYSQRNQYDPYEKHHSTVREACELASCLNVPNLILYHTEDDNIERRKALYTAEGRLYYKGNLYVPDDLECIEFDEV